MYFDKLQIEKIWDLNGQNTIRTIKNVTWKKWMAKVEINNIKNRIDIIDRNVSK